MKRRAILLAVALAGLVLAGSAQAQKPERTFRVAFLGPDLMSPQQPSVPGGYFDAVTKQLESRGIVAGRNLEVQFLYRRNDVPGGWDGPWRREMIQEAIAWKPDAIVIVGAEFAREARRAHTTIPIVFGLVQDPVTEGIVESLRRPEGNITGAGIDYYALAIKRLELAREMLPSLKRALIVWDRRGGPLPATAHVDFVRAAARLNVAVSKIDVAGVEGGLCNAGRGAKELKAQVILPMGNIGPALDDRSGKSWVQGYGDCLYEMQRRSGIPVIDDSSDTVGQGVVAAIGEESFESFRRAANVLARILGGAKPAEVPVDMQMRVQLAINAKSAREIGLALPPSVMLRADRIVE